ncbi:Predicted Rossmann fold nucleotide-binding protein [Kytococcus aerolatus]|uniref:Predicted Rossmann fold nucleotide-binding protein n=1 Tax=Kytococcus aerolatus TaxID=592308 RepID=A0A212U292_9MICO|nr:Predicted Rossmann fold nucleotide-binding protein [Kytococcus aerolatus]
MAAVDIPALTANPAIPLPGHRGLAHRPGRDLTDVGTFEALLSRVERGEDDLHRVALDGLDLTDLADRLRALPVEALHGLVVLGGTLPVDLHARIVHAGGVVFPAAPDAPVRPHRGTLYTAQELYAGLAEHGYEATPDARAYAWFRDERLHGDSYVSMLRAIHDESMVDALVELLTGREVVGVMGGHALRRGTAEYAAAARLGLRLADAGQVVLTGGGPGAMEAANLGALSPDGESLRRALTRLSAAPDFEEVGPWARAGLTAREELPVPASLHSVGIPTWFYGHEPPNPFGQQIAKLFSNALREDLLLAQSTAGLVVLPGAAGTVQEVFQVATRLYYATPGSELGALVLVGREHWTRTLPVWPLLEALGAEREMGRVLHLVDDVDEAVTLLARD